MSERSVVHSAYQWGRLTEGWIRDQAVPVGGFGVQVVCARSADPAPSRVRSLETEGPRHAVLVDRVIARVTGRRWAPAYVDLVDRGSAAVFHAHFGDWAYATYPIAATLDVPLVVSFYGYDAGQLPMRPLWRRRLRRLFREAARVLVEGPAMAARLQSIDCPEERLRVVPLAIDMRDWPPSTGDAGTRDGERLHFVIAASLREKKGVGTALKALALANGTVERPWRLTVVGDGPLRATLLDQAARLGIARHIDWLGYRPKEELRSILQSADVLLQTSQTAADGDTEGGAPVVLLEAAAAGVPVIGTTHADIGFIVADGSTGWLAPEGDAHAVAGLIRQAGSDERLAVAGRAARARAEERFDLPRMHRALAEVYREVAG